ncbi:MAG TPA: nitronate monooxygenase [Rhodanobacteraceae bacterium]|nr:nitronate monooxygenase [Rhodanobacteraceae bacterium]
MTNHPAARTMFDRLGMRVPIIQAPMAGVSTPAMAAAVAREGGLGSLGVGAMRAQLARAEIHRFRELGGGALNVNVFVHRPARADVEKEAAWIGRLQPEFARCGAGPPEHLREIYTSFLEDDAMLALLAEEKPAAASFHFGVPHPRQVRALHDAGIFLMATATSVREAQAIEAAGLDAIVAQGYGAGGHRGMFDPEADDDKFGTFALVRLLATTCVLPVIAAGGIMDGAGIAAALALGAAAVQLGTAFVGSDESLADEGYRARLFGDPARHTTMTRAISGRPARCLANDFTRWGASLADDLVPDYPIAYDVGKALHAAGKRAGFDGYGAQWAGQGAPLARRLSSQALMQALETEWREASATPV